MQNSLIDEHLMFCHRNGQLVGLMTVHVDDLKISRERDWVKRCLACLEKVFGELKQSWNDFTNCGVRHQKLQQPRIGIALDQIKYLEGLKPIAHAQVSTGRDTDECTPELHSLFRSLLGAIAYANHTRLDCSVFICALQRHSAKSQVQRIRKANKLLRWMQKRPK